MRFRRHTIHMIAAIVMLLASLAVPSTVQAQAEYIPALLGIGNLSSVVIGKVLFVLALAANFTAGILIALITWVLTLALTMNGDIVNSPVVQAGFPAVLALANLGFVLGIIVIAISTILRKETYGLKQILWRLVVMAVLVNFGLVIAGSIVNFADKLTLYFIHEIDPSDDFGSFATKIAGAFQPQNFHFVESLKNMNPTTVQELTQAFEIGGENAGRLVQNAIGLFLGFFAMSIVIIVLAVLVVMLIYRYVKIALALVLLPLAWLSWVFPALQNNFSRWWKSFMHQTFFAPIVVFFIWLMLITAEKMGAGSNDPLRKHFEKATAPSDPLFATINNFFSGLFGSVLANILQSFVLVGILMGGIIAANEFGIKLADAAQKGVDGVKGWATGALSRGAWKGGRALYQGTGLQKLGERMSASRVPGVSALGRTMVTLPALGGKDLVSQSTKEFERMETDQIVGSLKGFTGNEKRFAALNVLQKRGDVGKVDTIAGQTLAEFADGKQQLFKDYGQGKLVGDINKTMLSDKAMRDAAKAGDTEALRNATKEYVKKLSREDVVKADLARVFSGEPQFGLTRESFNALAGAIAGAFITDAEYLIPKVLPRLKANELKQYHGLHGEALRRELDRAVRMPEGNEQNEMQNQLAHAEEVYNKAIANNAFAFSEKPVETATQAPQPPTNPPAKT